MQQKLLMQVQPLLEDQLNVEEKKFEEALKADKEFSVLKEIRNRIHQIKNELYLQRLFWKKEKS